ILTRLEDYSGLALTSAFEIPDLDSVTTRHAKYARQNGIHGSPTFMIDPLIDPTIGGGDDVGDWVTRFLRRALHGAHAARGARRATSRCRLCSWPSPVQAPLNSVALGA